MENVKLLEDKSKEGLPQKYHNLLPWQYEVLRLKFLKPSITQVMLAGMVNRSRLSVSIFLRSDKYKNAVVEFGKDRFFHLIPTALNSFEEVLKSKNDNAKLNACLRILEDSGVLGKEVITRIMNQINTQINVSALELRGKGIDELNEMLLNQLRGGKRS